MKPIIVSSQDIIQSIGVEVYQHDIVLQHNNYFPIVMTIWKLKPGSWNKVIFKT